VPFTHHYLVGFGVLKKKVFAVCQLSGNYICFLNNVTIPQPLARPLRYSCQATRTVSNQLAASKKKLRPGVNNMAWATSKLITVSN
jgi:hypothetical protein